MKVVPFLCLFAIAVLALPAARPEEASEAGGGYAGSSVCVECHEDEYALWSRSTHARTLQPATPENLPRVVAEGGVVLHPPGRSEFRKETDGIVVRTTGPAGTEEDYPLTHALGARRIQMYLARVPSGRLQVIPSMLDMDRGDWFDYSHLIFGGRGTGPETPPRIRPGEPTFWTGMPRFFDARCAACHTTGHEFTPRAPEDPGPWSRYSEPSVGCEGCHGPAADHAAWWGDDPPDRLTEDPLPKLRNLDTGGALSLCLRCHTEGEAVDPGFEIGDDWFEHFDPPMLDDPEVLDPRGRELELIYDGVSFSVSECARAGDLTCATCHDVHGSAYRSQLVAPPGDPALCASCHEEIVASVGEHSHHDPARVGASCAGCHMPSLTIERGHGVVTDHTIGVPQPGLLPGRVAENACDWCHGHGRAAPGAVPTLGRDEIASAYGKWWPDAEVRPAWAAPIAAGRLGRPEAVPGLVSVAKDRDNPRIVRGSAARLLARYPGRASRALTDLMGDPDSIVRRAVADAFGSLRGDEADSVLLGALFDDSPAVRLAAARAALRGWDRVRARRTLLESILPVLEESVDAFPEDDERWFLLGAARQIAGDLEGAVRAYDRKLALDPYARLVRRTVERLRTQLR